LTFDATSFCVPGLNPCPCIARGILGSQFLLVFEFFYSSSLVDLAGFSTFHVSLFAHPWFIPLFVHCWYCLIRHFSGFSSYFIIFTFLSFRHFILDGTFFFRVGKGVRLLLTSSVTAYIFGHSSSVSVVVLYPVLVHRSSRPQQSSVLFALCDSQCFCRLATTAFHFFLNSNRPQSPYHSNNNNFKTTCHCTYDALTPAPRRYQIQVSSLGNRVPRHLALVLVRSWRLSSITVGLTSANYVWRPPGHFRDLATPPIAKGSFSMCP